MGSGMAKRPATLRTRILNAAMKLAAEHGWRDLTRGQIAAAAKVSLAQLHANFPAGNDILIGVMERADAEVLENVDPASVSEPVHDRLLDAVMRRLDALAPYKPGIKAVLRDMARDPLAALAMAPACFNAMGWMLESSGIGCAGPGGRLRVKGLSLIYLSTLCVWVRDDSEDSGATLSHLDRRLRQAARLVPFLPGARRRHAAAES
jgi:AcrR family transcriptional regulator